VVVAAVVVAARDEAAAESEVDWPDCSAVEVAEPPRRSFAAASGSSAAP
jgi:hypothetical protein